ncbi:hypothetical protein FRB94_007815 [Tulasnella sp. JGI-2019a]|nr:hypothetical protein FRB94_007815 [Tulasnella sp. JGI-2019a]
MAAPGASNNERLLHAAKQDDDGLILEIFGQPTTFDINHVDGLGNTALHYAVKSGSADVLEQILEHDDCDVDPQNRLERATPLHMAAQLEDKEVRFKIVKSLLDAGADMRIRDKHGSLAVDLLPGDDEETRQLFRKAQADAAISKADIAGDSDGEEGSGSGED